MRPLLLVLTVIQNAETRAFVRMVLEGAGHRVIETAGSSQACALLSNGLEPDLLLCEASPIDSTETAPFRRFLKFVSAQSICLIARMSEQGLRQEAFALGIKHFLTMPVTRGDLESVVDSLSPFKGQFCADRALTHDSDAAAGPGDSAKWASDPPDMPAVPYVDELGGKSFFLAASPQMLEIHRQVKLLADIDVNVLILGESGTGKEIIAQLIHKNSRRSREKFLKVNCAALPADLLEERAFRAPAGRFHGSHQRQAGQI